jgi:uncharacterized protein (TIGR02391 family)
MSSHDGISDAITELDTQLHRLTRDSDFQAFFERFRRWKEKTATLIATAVSADEARRFKQIPAHDWTAGFDWIIGRHRSHLQVLLEAVDSASAADAAPSAVLGLGRELWWLYIHPAIRHVAQSRFETGHLADAVEAAMKEVNAATKARVHALTGQELDGSSLMNTAFSPRTPLLLLGDLNTESGRNVQQGYMQIFAGAITGIRNPKAHENLTITTERAVHLLFLASLLRFKLDEAQS